MSVVPTSEIEMRKFILLFLFVSISMDASAQWNNWSNAKTARKTMLKAQEQGLTYFSQFHLWDVRAKNIHTSQYHEKTDEVLYIYALDFYYASGTYFADDMQAKYRQNIIEVVKKQWRENKAIPSFSWHLENPYVTSGYDYMGCRYRKADKNIDYPDNHEYVVREILSGKGGDRCGNGRYSGNESTSWENPQKWFDACCREVASLINEFRDDNGQPIPIIFRLWHECEDNWMWWGSGSTTPEEYKQLFILTEKKIKRYARRGQILWAYCPDSYWRTEEDFMLRYPGDKYVDIIGYDDYQLGDPKKLSAEIEKGRIVSRVATEHKKIAALFESANKYDETADNFYKDCLMPFVNDSQTRFGLVQIWSSGKFENEKQYEDRRVFLSQSNILKVK